MTDDDIIRMYQELLRQAPENKDLKESIKRWHRRKEVRSQRASPPPRRTLDALKELLTESLRQNPDKRPSPDLPIDAEISKLLDKGATYLDGRQAVVDGCMWGDYYARSPNRPANLTTWRVGKAKRERQATGLRQGTDLMPKGLPACGHPLRQARGQLRVRHCLGRRHRVLVLIKS